MPKQTTSPKRPSLKTNALSNWAALGVNIAIGFVLTPAILAHLGEKRFGIWMLVSSVVGYFGLLRLGVGTGVLRYVPLFRAKNDRDKISATISTAMAFYVVIGFVIFVTLLLFSGLIADFFEGGQELAILIRIVGLAAALGCPALILDAAIRSYEYFVIANLASVFSAILRAGVLFGCIFMGYGLVPLGWAIVILTFLGLIVQGIAFRVCCSDVKLDIQKISLSALKPLMSYGLIIMVESGAIFLTYESPKQVIGKVISFEALGYFCIAALLVRYYRRLIYSLTKVLMPRFSYLSGQNANHKIRRLFLHGSRYVTITAGALALLLWSVGPSFLQLWTKNDNINQAVPALVILVAGALILLSHRISIDLLYGLGKQKKLAALAMIEGILVLGLSLGLSSRYGITGIAVAVSVSLILVRGVIQTIYVCRLLKVDFWEYYNECMFKPWIIAIILAGAGYWLGAGNFAKNWLFLFLVSAVLLLTYGTAIYIFALKRAEKRQLSEHVSGILRHVRGWYLSQERGAL